MEKRIYVRMRSVFVGICLLTAMVLILLTRDKDDVSNLSQYQYNMSNLAQYNVSNLAQDDPRLISLIRDQYLVPPAAATTKLNFSSPIWRSPVVKVVHKLLQNKTGGYFLECGAFDGEFLSNTIELEHYFGWKGVLVEADPKYQKRLLKKGRKAWVAPVCLSPRSYPKTARMVRHKEWVALSKISDSRSDPDFPFSFEVKCFPLYSIVAALNRTEIDYLSLDVEGFEHQIIRSIPFEKLKIKVISMEFPLNNAHIVNDMKQFLGSKGFVFQTTVLAPYVHDLIFVHQSELRNTDTTTYERI